MLFFVIVCFLKQSILTLYNSVTVTIAIMILLCKLHCMKYWVHLGNTKKQSHLKDREQKGAIVIFRLVLV